jgi:Transglycosylase-like domain
MQWPEPANTEQRKAPARPTKGGAVRTRIALVAIAPIAIITTTVLMQAATVQSARGAAVTPSGAQITSTIHLTGTSHRPGGQPMGSTGPSITAPAGSSLVLDLNDGLLAHAATARGAATAPAAPPAAVPAPPVMPVPAGPVDTVTPAQRTAWERVAMCEEGGNWNAESSRFSGGLGITRANWDVYGGRAFAPEGAMATEDQQIMVAQRIQPDAPDQYGCRGW